MRSVIVQSVVLPTSPKALFAMYLNPRDHAAITGNPVTIGRKAGAKFSAFEGMITGTMLAVVRPRLIVQSWRSFKFRKRDPDSTLILSFQPAGKAGRIHLVHLDVPPHDYEGVTQGWKKHYWTPWRRYLKTRM